MIKGTFRLGGDIVEAVIKGNDVMFSDVSTGMITTVEGLKISKVGVVKEFPDLENDPEWKKKALDRLKQHIKKYKTEDKKLDYIKQELKKFGYEPMMKQKAGFRPKPLT